MLLAVVACGRVADEPFVPALAGGGGASAAGGISAGGVFAGGASAGGASAGGPLAQAGESASGSGGAAAGAAGGPAEAHPYRALQVVAGSQHSCALLEDNQVKCWGSSSYGQLGLGSTDAHGLTGMGDELPLVDLGKGRSARTLAAGRYTTCALLDDDSVKCWGLNIMRQGIASPTGGEPSFSQTLLGDGPNEMGDALLPVQLGAGHRAVKLALGHNSGCIALEDDSFVCGGTSNEYGVVPAALGVSLSSLVGSHRALGLYDDGSLRWIPAGTSERPEPLMTDVLMAGGASSCYVTWSRDEALRFNGKPEAIATGTVRSIAATEICQHVCVVLGDDRVQCWRTFGGMLSNYEPTEIIPCRASPSSWRADLTTTSARGSMTARSGVGIGTTLGSMPRSTARLGLRSESISVFIDHADEGIGRLG